MLVIITIVITSSLSSSYKGSIKVTTKLLQKINVCEMFELRMFCFTHVRGVLECIFTYDRI